MKLKYCASSLTSFTRLMMFKEQKFIDFINGQLERINNRIPNIDLTILYNAFTEPDVTKYYELLKENGLPLLFYTDSGGLQVNLTQTQGSKGAKINIEDTKMKIYEEQTKLSDFAMCFDEMPVHINEAERTDDMHTRLDPTGRYFVSEDAFEKGRQTGVNVRNQIKKFKELGANTKVMVIIQGFTFEDYDEYAKGAYSEIPDEYYDQIGGIAIANTLTISAFESLDVMMRHQHHFTSIPKEHLKHVHLLGVGGVNRLYPMLIMGQKESYWDDFVCNFDSTSATSAFVFGWSSRVENNKVKKIKLGYTRNVNTDHYCSYLYEHFSDHIARHLTGVDTLEDFRNLYTIYNDSGKRKKADFEEHEKEFMEYVQLNAFLSTVHELETFMVIADKIMNQRQFKYLGTEFRSIASLLNQSVHTIDDYMKYRDHFRYMLSTKKAKLNYISSKEEIDKKFQKKQLVNKLF